MKCPKCSGLMFPETAQEFYEQVFFQRCVNCGKVVEVGSKRFGFRNKEEVREEMIVVMGGPVGNA